MCWSGHATKSIKSLLRVHQNSQNSSQTKPASENFWERLKMEKYSKKNTERIRTWIKLDYFDTI